MHMLLWQKKVFPEQGAETEEHSVNKMANWEEKDVEMKATAK